ncbi:MAG: S49 family peptidase [Candidatus Cryptobacteroides sp.]
MPNQDIKILFLASVPQHAASSHLVIIEDKDRKPYRECVAVPPDCGLSYPSDFSDPNIPDGSIAFHPVLGDVYYQSILRFSTKQFIADIKAADENPAIKGHLIYVDSCGGEAFGCHEAFLAVKDLTKPVYAFIESIAASAGYYLAAAADKIYASSIFTEAGCIGVMCTYYDWSEYLKKEGIEERTYISNYSPLKNKVTYDALEGNGDEYVRRFLDPMALQFIEDIKSTREGVSEDAQKGEIYYSPEAQAAALIDGQFSLEEVLEMLRKEAGKTESSPSVDINSLNL